MRVIALMVILVLAGNAYAASREGSAPARERGRDSAIVKVVKKIVRALGDGLTVPLP